MNKLLAIAAVVVAGLVGTVATVYGVSAFRASQEVAELVSESTAFPEESTRPTPTEPTKAPKKPVNILVLGVDSGAKDIRDFENLRNRRSDAMILVNISGDRSEVTLVSLMRDLWVDIPGHRTDKLNAAVSLGGVPMAVAAVEQLLDVRVDHVIVSDFDGLIGLTDSFGGVDIVNPQRFNSYHIPGRVFEAGPQRMNGAELLAFTQERFAFRDGDYTRVKNQRQALQALATSMAKSIRPLSPWEVPGKIKQVGQFVAIDQSLTLTTMVRLAIDLITLDPQVGTLTLPTLGTGTTPGGQSIVIPDYAGIQEVSEALKEDRVYQLQLLVD